MGTEHSIKISRAKINSLFHNITQKLDGGNNLLAKKLRISTSTLDEYLRLGKLYLVQFEDEYLSDVIEIDTEFIDEEYENRRDEFKNEYMLKENINALGDKYRNAFEVYFYELREKDREKYIYNIQKELIESIEFDKDSNLNEKIKLLLLFRLVYDRADLSIDEEKLYLKARYTKTSSKHVNTIIKDLERRNQADFGVKQKEIPTGNTTTNNITNFVQLCIEQEREMKKKQISVDKNDEDIIDI